MEHETYLNRVDRLKKTVDKALTRTNKAGNNEYFDNVKALLENMGDDLSKFEGLIKGERKPAVGVFGCPSRGKSTLLNVLLGVDILPMKGKAGTTRFGIELLHKNTEGFYVTVKYNSKPPEASRESLTEDDIKDQLKHFSGQSDLVNPDITKIEIQGPFRSFLGNDVVFIDTPGVELGASADDLPDGSPLKHDFEADTKRALAILSSVDVVIFCMTNKYKEKKDAVFYNKAIRDQYEPINVITAGDKRDDDQTNEDIKLLVQKDYRLIKSHTVVVSSKEALEKTRDARANGKDIAETVESEFTGENLEDFKKLKQMILKRVRITGKDIENRLARFEELYKNIRQGARAKGVDLDSDSFTGHAGAVLNNGELLSASAWWFYNRGNYESAIADITKAIQEDPLNAEYYNIRAKVYKKMDKYDKVLDDMSKAIVLNPNNAAYYNTRATIFYRQKDYASAITDYTKMIQLNPKSGMVFCNRGIAYYRRGENNPAINDLSKAIQLNPKIAAAYYFRGVAYYAQENYTSAINDLSKAIQLDPKYATAYGWRGIVYYAQKDYDSAIEDYDSAIQLSRAGNVVNDEKLTALFTNRAYALAKKREKDNELGHVRENRDKKKGINFTQGIKLGKDLFGAWKKK